MAVKAHIGQAPPASIADKLMPSRPSTQNPPSEERAAVLLDRSRLAVFVIMHEMRFTR